MSFRSTTSVQRTGKVKCVVVGDTSVGKSALSLRWCTGSFAPTETTIGAAFLAKACVVARAALSVNVWDTAGQERFVSRGSCRRLADRVVHPRKALRITNNPNRETNVTLRNPTVLGCVVRLRLCPAQSNAPPKYRASGKAYYRDSDMALLVFDASRPETLDGVSDVWLPAMREELGELMPICALVAAKMDLGEMDGDLETRARDLAHDNKMLFHKTSAKTGEGVKRAFEALAEQLVQREGAAAQAPTTNKLMEEASGARRVGKKRTKKLHVTSTTELPGDEEDSAAGCKC